jgi:carbohydrate-selective porin OprB
MLVAIACGFVIAMLLCPLTGSAPAVSVNQEPLTGSALDTRTRDELIDVDVTLTFAADPNHQVVGGNWPNRRWAVWDPARNGYTGCTAGGPF